MPSGPVGYDRTYPPSHLWPPPRVIGLTVHELKELVDNGLEELPVGPEEAGVLAHDVHDVGGYDGLVVLAPLLLTKTQQILEAESASRTYHTPPLECYRWCNRISSHIDPVRETPPFDPRTVCTLLNFVVCVIYVSNLLVKLGKCGCFPGKSAEGKGPMQRQTEYSSCRVN